MAFNSSLIHLYLLIIIIPLFPSPVYPLSIQHQSSYHPRVLLFEEKTRLGSTPPSCYNKCNQCHPCTAVQVPTFRSLHRVQPPASIESGRVTVSSVASFEYEKSSGEYSNYKPLGWKCRCRDHFYNP